MAAITISVGGVRAGALVTVRTDMLLSQVNRGAPTSMTAPALDRRTLPAAFQIGYTAGQKAARQHRRRTWVLEDQAGLTAYATDAAHAALPTQPRGRAALLAQYIAGSIQAYQQETGQEHPAPSRPARRPAPPRKRR